MRKLPTGEPYAGKPPVRFGGRGGVTPFPTPIGPQIGSTISESALRARNAFRLN